MSEGITMNVLMAWGAAADAAQYPTTVSIDAMGVKIMVRERESGRAPGRLDQGQEYSFHMRWEDFFFHDLVRGPIHHVERLNRVMQDYKRGVLPRG